MENLLDYRIQNRQMQDALKKSITNMFPIKSAGKLLHISNIRIEDDLDPDDFPYQKELKLNRKSWQIPIVADFSIEDEKGKVLNSTKGVKIGNIPKLTNRFTTIVDGNEYQTVNQIRRKSGIYSRVKKNGELESEFNLAKGQNFKMQLDPTSQLFVISFANRKYRLWTLLHHLGVSDMEISKAWGKQLLDINKAGALNTEWSELSSIYERIYKRKPKDIVEASDGLQKYFSTETELDPDTTKITLGESYDKVNWKSLLAASRKLLNINKGLDKPDERDSLIFKRIYSVDDLLLTYFDKQSAALKKKLERTLDLKNTVREVVTATTFGEPIKKFFTVGDLSSTPAQTNPVTIASEWRKTTPMGMGGISSSHAITMETRDVQPTHFGFLDPLSTPESGKVGVAIGLASEVAKHKNEMATIVVDLAGKRHYLTPTEMYDKKIGFPDQYIINKPPNTSTGGISARYPFVTIMHRGETKKVPAAEVKYYLRSVKGLFSYPQNLVPFIANTQGNRASTGARMITQAMSLDNHEVPLVQTMRDSDTTYEEMLGGYLIPNAKASGVITAIDDDYIHLKYNNGKTDKIGLYNNFPLNQDGHLHSKVLVKVGDKVTPETDLYEHNYSRGNTLALGKNLNVAYMSYKGYNFEDGAVITESAAQKLSHTMIHRINVFFSPKLSVFDKRKFNAWFPDEMTSENFAKLDEEGLIKPGTEVKPGDVVCAFLVERELEDTEAALKKLDKYTFHNYIKNISKWEEEEVGIVTDVRKVGRNIDIYIKASHPLKEGDKVAGRYGNKSIITKIISDSDAPHRQDGTPIDILLSPEGVPGRMNIGQILETAASKIAEKTGKPFIVDNFENPDEDTSNKIAAELTRLKIPIDETLIDGKTGKPIGNQIFTGKQYIMKLRHIVKKKLGVHNFGSYDVNEQPSGKGAQKIGILDTYGYLAHGAKHNLRETGEIKSRQNEEYWRNLQFGLPPIKPNRNFVFDKFTNYLKAMGVNVSKEGNQLRIYPLTDKDIKEMSAGALTDPGAMLIGKNLQSRKGGLFDINLTGGLKGKNWTHIPLASRIPNPMYEDAIIKALDLTEQKYKDILSGKLELDGDTGVNAIVKGLEKINVDKTLTKLQEDLKSAPPTNVNKLNTRIKYLRALKNLGITAKDAYTTGMVPVIPPAFRPIYPLPSGDLMVSDVNKHYRDVGLINDGLKANKDSLTAGDLVIAQNSLYNSVKALQGFIDPITYSQEKYKGFMAELAKTKTGLIHGKLWSKRQDLSGRSTITVEPDLGIDEVGIPVKMAYTIMKPFIIRDLKLMGFKASAALKEYEDETPLAKRSLSNILEERPVIINRAPSLHKHSMQAFKPVLVSGKAIKLNPMIVRGFNADFDGDTMSVMVPIGKEAVDEARGMMPSKILFKHGDNSLVPELSKDYIFGLYELSKIGSKSTKTFTSIEDAKKSGINWTTQFKLNNKLMTIGQYYINKNLPAAMRDYTRVLDGKTAEKILTELGKKHPEKFSDVINEWKTLGASYAYEVGHTISLTDFAINRSYRDDILKKELPEIDKLPVAERITALNNLTRKVEEAQNKNLANKNHMYKMLESGSFSKKDSVRQVVSMPGLITGLEGKILDLPITKSYAEGLDSPSYWNTLYGVRTGTVDRSVNTQESGALNKSLLNINRRLLITMEDCGTKKGLEFELDDKNVLDRTLVNTIKGIGKRNEVVDQDILLKSKKAKLSTLLVRSPLTCEAVEGICRYCYGLMPDGQLPAIGENVGILDSEAVTERATQLTMQTFHCFHPHCTIYTEEGHIRTIEDVVFSGYQGKILDINGQFTKIKKAWKHEIEDEIVYIKTKDGHSLIAQQNHPVQVFENTYKCQYCGGRLKGKQRQCAVCSRRSKEAVVNLNYKLASTIEIKDLKVGEDSFLINSYPANFDTIRWDWEIDPYMLGAWIAEGSINRRPKETQQNGVVFTQNPNTAIFDKYASLLKTSQSGKNFYIYNQALADRLEKECGSYSNSKKLPYNILNYSRIDIIKILAGLIDGDGTIQRFANKGRHKGNDVILIDTTSYALANQLIILGNALGISINMHQATVRPLSNYQPFKISLKLTKEFADELSLYSIKIHNLKTGILTSFIDKGTIKQIQNTMYSYDAVYDIETESNTLLVNEIWTHNSGGSAMAGGGITAGFPRLEQLVNMPQKLSGKATLSTVNGIVKKVIKNQTGGYNVTVGEKTFVVPAGRRPVVEVGQNITAGDALSDGVVKPQELGELKDHLTAQRYLVGEASKIYGDKFYKKTFETMVRGISDNAEINDAPDDSGFLRGDKTTKSFVDYLNRKRAKEGLQPIGYTPYLKSILTLNTDQDDWMVRVSTNRIKQAISTGAAKGQYANIKGKDPIPAYLYGEDFGKNINPEAGEFY